MLIDLALKDLKENRIFFKEKNFNQEFKIKCFEEKQVAVTLFYNLINNNINPFLLELNLDDFDYLPVFDKLIDSLLNYLPHSQLDSNTKFKCFKCLSCEHCNSKTKRLKDPVDIKEFIHALVLKKMKPL